MLALALVWALTIASVTGLALAQATGGHTAGKSSTKPAAQNAVELPEDTFPHDDGDDPIGIDEDARSLDALATQRNAPRVQSPPDQAFGPTPPAPSARAGEILTAIPAARESSHRVHVELEPGLATVDVEITLTSTADKPCEARYRLAIPKGARLAELKACNAAGCRQGIANHAPAGRSVYDAAVLARAPGTRLGAHAGMPVAHAQLTQDGAAIVVRAAPVVKDKPLTLTLRYEADAPMHGGTVRFGLAARGMDPRAAQTEVSVTARGLLDARVAGQTASAGPLVSDAWVELPITASAASGTAPKSMQRRLRCDGAPCTHARTWAGPRPLLARNILLALDVSPSTEGPARGRLLAALAAVLEAAPPESRVRAVAFAARAAVVIDAPTEPGLVALAPFVAQIESAQLGAATRFEAVWQHAEPMLKRSHVMERAGPRAGLRPLIIVLGDGGITTGDSDAFVRAKRAGIEVAAVNVSDRRALRELAARVHATGGVVIEAGASAQIAANGRNTEQLVEQVSALFAPTLASSRAGALGELGPLRAGEALSSLDEVRPGSKGSDTHNAYGAKATSGDALYTERTALVAVDERDRSAQARQSDWPTAPIRRGVCDRRGPSQRRSGLSSDAAPLALAEERPCAFATAAPATPTASALGAGMPSDPLLDMLRQRVLPLARGCFRRDRGGRAQYVRRALFVFSLADREVLSAHVEGRISDALRECLLGAVDTLEVPRFTGTVRVSYPLVTEAAPVAEQIELTPVTAQKVDALLGGTAR